MEDLAKLLGWNHDGGKGSNILTRYEIVESLKNGVKVKLDSGKEAYIFNLHLPSHPYQPYQLLGIRPKWHKHTNDIEFIKTEAEAIEWAKRPAVVSSQELLEAGKIHPRSKMLLCLWSVISTNLRTWTGPKLRPSPVATRSKWPIPPRRLWLRQALAMPIARSIRDEMKNPGLTWSPKYTVR